MVAQSATASEAYLAFNTIGAFLCTITIQYWRKRGIKTELSSDRIHDRHGGFPSAVILPRHRQSSNLFCTLTEHENASACEASSFRVARHRAHEGQEV